MFDPNIDNNDNFMIKEDGLKEIIADYNKMYGQLYNLSNFPKLKQDIVQRFAHKKPYNLLKSEEQIDLLIVVDQMLTGFDSKWINTLYLDKVLKYENIIQAFSRTNRIFGDDKPFGIIKYYRYPHTMEQNINKAVKLYSGDKPFGLFVNKLDKNKDKLNEIYKEISDFFESNAIDNFEKLPDDPMEKKKFASLYKRFKKVLDSARIQGLSDKDFKSSIQSTVSKFDEYKIDESFNFMIAENSIPYTSSSNSNELNFNQGDITKIFQRANDLIVEGKNSNDNVSYDIDSYVTEYDIEKIDAEYLNSKFEKYLRDLTQENISQEELDKSLSELNNAFAYLSIEQQKYANIFIHDIASKNVEIESGKAFIEYVTEYQCKVKNDLISKISEELGLDESLLRRMMGLNLNELNINEFGNFDALKKSVNVEKAREYFKKEENCYLPIPIVNVKVDKLLRNLIIKDKH